MDGVETIVGIPLNRRNELYAFNKINKRALVMMEDITHLGYNRLRDQQWVQSAEVFGYDWLDRLVSSQGDYGLITYDYDHAINDLLGIIERFGDCKIDFDIFMWGFMLTVTFEDGTQWGYVCIAGELDYRWKSQFDEQGNRIYYAFMPVRGIISCCYQGHRSEFILIAYWLLMMCFALQYVESYVSYAGSFKSFLLPFSLVPLLFTAVTTMIAVIYRYFIDEKPQKLRDYFTATFLVLLFLCMVIVIIIFISEYL